MRCAGVNRRRQRLAARSQINRAIEEDLDKWLPRTFTPELHKEKCSTLFEHVYERYPQAGAGVHAGTVRCAIAMKGEKSSDSDD